MAVVEHHQLDDDGAGVMMMKLIWIAMRSSKFYLADHDQPTGDDIECLEEADVTEA